MVSVEYFCYPCRARFTAATDGRCPGCGELLAFVTMEEEVLPPGQRAAREIHQIRFGVCSHAQTWLIRRRRGAGRCHRPAHTATIREVMRHVFRIVLLALAGVWLTACAVSQPNGPTRLRPAYDTILVPGEIQVAETHLRDFGYDPGPVDGIYTDQTQAAVRAYQARYGVPVSGLLDRQTRRELLPGFGLLGIFR